MEKISLLLTLFAFLASVQAQDFRSQAPKPGKAPKILLGDYQTFKLNNGLTVILVENHELPTVAFSLQLDLEPIAEGKQAGIASFAGELLRAGTTTRTKSQLDEEIDFIGASLSTGSSGIFGSSLKKHQGKLLELMADILYHPVFPQEEFDKLRKQILSVLQMNSSDPNEIASVVSKVLRYGQNHPYGEPTTEETVGNITRESVEQYYQTYFKPDIAYLIMIGDLTLDEGKKLAGHYFDSWKSGTVNFKPVADPAPLTGNLVGLVDRPAAVQSVISVTQTFTLKPGHADVLPAQLMNTVLGGGVFSSRLMQNLREDKAYTYGASSSLNPDKHIGYFAAGTQVRTSVTDSAVTEILAEMRRMQNELISEEQLRMNKNIMAGEFARALENPSTLATFALNTIRYELPADYYATYLERLEQTTAEQVREMARKYLKPDQCIILVVGSKSQTGDKLARFSATNSVLCYDRYGNPMESIAPAMPEGVDAKYVIDNYIQAIGGRVALRNVRQLTSSSIGKVEAMGQTVELDLNSWQVAPDRLCQETRMRGMVMQKQVCDGNSGWMVNMGSVVDVTGPELQLMKEGARLFPELFYQVPGYNLTLEGIENIGGQNAYRIRIVTPAGNTQTDFFNMADGLKVRSLSVMEVNGESLESITDYSDYRTIEGVKFPWRMKQSVAGQILDIEVRQIDTTTEVDPALFVK